MTKKTNFLILNSYYWRTMMIRLQYNLKTTAAYIKRNDEDVKKIFLKVKQGRPQKAQVHAKTQPQVP
jgi:hypothetical protein